MEKSSHNILRAYELAGVRVFKKWMPLTGDNRFSISRMSKIDQVDRSEESINKMLGATQFLEVGHGAMFVIGLAAVATKFFTGEWDNVTSAGFFAANALLNYYPVLVQRYNRIRLKSALERTHEHKETMKTIHEKPAGKKKNKIRK